MASEPTIVALGGGGFSMEPENRTEAVEYFSSRPNARAYLVTRTNDGATETMIEPTLLEG